MRRRMGCANRRRARRANSRLQALWFEQLVEPWLKTDDGREVEVIQPGFWNHAGGPDFTRAVVRSAATARQRT